MTINETIAEMTRLMDGLARFEHRTSDSALSIIEWLEVTSTIAAAHDLIQERRDGLKRRYAPELDIGSGLAL